MKTTSVRNLGLNAIAGTVLAVGVSASHGSLAEDEPVWDKTFPKSNKVEHRKVTFMNRYGITHSADLYQLKNRNGNWRRLPWVSELNGNEKYFYLSTRLPTDA